MKSKTSTPNWLHALTDYFTFSRAHRRGSLFLLFINILLSSGYYFVDYLRPVETYDPTPFQKEIALLESSIQKAQPKKQNPDLNQKDTMYNPSPVTAAAPTLFTFDPNTLNKKGFVSLGLSARQADVLINYRNKGGRFRKKEDLKKMYCIQEKEYKELEAFIDISIDSLREHGPETKPILTENSSSTPRIFDLNSIHVADLDSIRGIGPAIANAIARYREKLGGFSKVDQLYEVFGIDSLLFAKIAPQFQVGPGFITKININKGFADELKHPYLDRALARLIVNYRRLHGPFGSVGDLKKLALVNDELYLKLAPYLTTE